MLEKLTLVDALDVVDLQEHGQRYFVDLICGANLTFASAESHLVVGALCAKAFVQAYIDRGTELHIRRVGELEGFELGAQNVSLDGVEVLKQVRIHSASKRVKY